MRSVKRVLYPALSLLLRPVRDRIVRAAYARADSARDERTRRIWSDRAYVYRRRLYGDARALRLARRPDGLDLWVDIAEWEGGNLFFGRPYEPVEMAVALRLIDRGTTVLDVGANVGMYTLLASRAVGDEGRVHAFEPVSRTYDLLRRNVAMNGARNVVLERCAVADSGGTVRVAVNRESGLSSLGATGRGSVLDVEAVPSVTLDQYSEEHGLRGIGLLKVDVEGFEGHVLRGARRLLGSDLGIAVLAEVSEQNFRALGLDPDALISWMRGLGFRAWQVGAASIAPLEAGPRQGENVFFARPGTRAAERLAALERDLRGRGGAGP